MKINKSRRSFLKLLICSTAQVFIDKSMAASFAGNFYNLSDFGAVNDGLTDCSNAFELAVAELNRTGGTLILDAGSYLLRKSLNIIVNKNIRIIGDNASIIYDSLQDNKYAINFTGDVDKITCDNKNDADETLNMEVLKKDILLNSNDAILIVEDNLIYKQLDNLSFCKVGNFSYTVYSTSPIFNYNMLNQNLVSNNNTYTFYLDKIIDNRTVSVIPGNNQPVDSFFAPNDLLSINSLWCKSRSYYTRGEIITANSLPTNIINIANYKSIYDSYTINHLNVYRISSGSLIFSGINLIAQKNQLYGINIEHVNNVLIKNVNVSGFKNNSLRLFRSANVSCDSINLVTSVSNLPSNYSCLFDSSQNISILNSDFYGGFHALSFGGTLPCRNITIDSSIFDQSDNWGLDFHGNCEYINLNNLKCNTGAFIGGVNATIKNSFFQSLNLKLAALLLGLERDCKYYVIDNNTIRSNKNGIVLSSQFAMHNINNVEVTNNKIFANGDEILISSYPFGVDPTIQQLIFISNYGISGLCKYKIINNITKFVIIHEINK